MNPSQHTGVELSDTRPRILYVEDNAINSKVVRYGLRQVYEVIVAVDARQACAEIRTHHDEFVAVLMDIELQGSDLDGIELTRLLRGVQPVDTLPEYARGLPTMDVPIVIVTAFTERYATRVFDEAGADFHMSKPVNLAALLGWLDDHIRH